MAKWVLEREGRDGVRVALRNISKTILFAEVDRAACGVNSELLEVVGTLANGLYELSDGGAKKLSEGVRVIFLTSPSAAFVFREEGL